MHIIVTREDVSKYGLQGLVDPQENAALSLDGLMGLLGYGPITKPGQPSEPGHPLSVLWVDTLRLRARIEAAAEKLPDDILDSGSLGRIANYLGEVACEVSTALACDLNAKAHEAAGLTAAA
jgi:hypothetical protein